MKAPEGPARAKTGVEGLDAMLAGGLPVGSVVLLRGGPGAGKTTLALQFLAQGAKQGEKGLYITLEESAAEVAANAARYGLQLPELIAKGDIRVYALALTRSKEHLRVAGAGGSSWQISVESTTSGSGFTGDFGSDTLTQLITRLIKETGAVRAVFDSLTMFTSQFEHRVDLHLETLELVRGLMRNGCTTLLTAHADPSGHGLSVAPEEYIAHGAINMHFLQQQGKVLQAIQVLKMRGISHDREMRPYRIGPGGITVYPNETVIGG